NGEFDSFGGVSSRDGRAGAFYRLPDQESQVAPQIFPYGMLPDINTGITDRSLSAGVRGTSRGWDVDFGLTHGRNDFQFIIDNTVNASLGAASPTTFDAGRLAFAQTTGNLDLVRPLAIGGLKSVAFVTGAEFRLENYRIEAGDAASWQLGNGGTRKGIDYDTTSTGGAKQPGSQDRKSTRLNSSHLGISYAVFCLKKKKTQHNEVKLSTSQPLASGMWLISSFVLEPTSPTHSSFEPGHTVNLHVFRLPEPTVRGAF